MPDVRDRQFLITFYKQAKKIGLDVERYNELRDAITLIEKDISRLRDPLRLHLPHSSLQSASERGKVFGDYDEDGDSGGQSPSSASDDADVPSEKPSR